MVTLADVKTALGITGDYLDNTLQMHIDEVMFYLNDAGISADDITAGIVARGVSDLWNYGAGAGRLSDYFYERAKQLSLK